MAIQEDDLLEATDDEETEEELVEFQASGEASSVPDPIETGSSRRKADKTNAMPMQKLGKTGVIAQVVDAMAGMTPGQAGKVYKGLMSDAGNKSSIKAKENPGGKVKLHALANIKVKEDLESLFGDQESLTEDFFDKAATIFEAALKSKIRTELERLEEEYAEAYDSAISEAKDELTTKVDGYLTYVVEEWMKKNELAVEHRLKTELAEQFIVSLRKLFEEHDIAIPDERFDMLEAAATQADDMEGRLNEEIEKNVELTQKVNELSKNEILLDVASDLADTEVEKFAELAESVEYENVDDYRLKLETIKDSYFPKATVTEEVEAAPNYDEVEMTSGKMAAYMTAIGKAEKRAS